MTEHSLHFLYLRFILRWDYSLYPSLDKLGGHEACLVASSVLLEEVREEKILKDSEHDEEFDEDDGPQRFAETHVTKSVVIKVECPVPKTVFVHRSSIYAANIRYNPDTTKIFLSFFLNILKMNALC